MISSYKAITKLLCLSLIWIELLAATGALLTPASTTGSAVGFGFGAAAGALCVITGSAATGLMGWLGTVSTCTGTVERAMDSWGIVLTGGVYRTGS